MHLTPERGCDLLENTYLCGSNNNYIFGQVRNVLVVICLKIRTFVVATTTFLSYGTQVTLL